MCIFLHFSIINMFFNMFFRGTLQRNVQTGHGGTLMLLCADCISVYIYLTIGKHFKALLYVNSMLIVC